MRHDGVTRPDKAVVNTPPSQAAVSQTGIRFQGALRLGFDQTTRFTKSM